MPSQIAGIAGEAFIFIAGGATVLFLLIVLTAFVVLGAPRARLNKRIAAVVGTSSLPSAVSAKSSEREQELAGRKKKVKEKLKEAEALAEQRRGARIRQALIHAGLSTTPLRFVIYSIISAAVVTGIAWVFDPPPVVLLATVPIGGLGLPKFVLNYLVKRRLKKFTALFADAIDVIVRGIRAGLTVGECLNVVAREMPAPLGPEFRLVTEGIRLGMTTAEALQRFSDRVPTSEVRFFAIVLVTQQSTGGNLAETLAKLSDVLRSRKRMRDKIQAMSGEAKASAAIIGSLPFIMMAGMAFLQPALIGLLFTHPTGHFLLGIGFVMLIAGSLVMRKMINFDI